jgi:hemerythrin-like domain-containing protein
MRDIVMSATERYRQHHTELHALFARIEGLLHNTAGNGWAGELTRLLAEFTGRLSTHLSVEDTSLYPTLTASGNPALAAMAQRYQTEMGDLYSTYMDFWRRWRTPAQVQREMAAFLPEARQLFSRLKGRIHREDTELYALADKVLA